MSLNVFLALFSCFNFFQAVMSATFKFVYRLKGAMCIDCGVGCFNYIKVNELSEYLAVPTVLD